MGSTGVIDAAFSALEALYTADSGSTGLKNSASAANVPFVRRVNSQDFADNWPRIEVDIVAQDVSPLTGVAASPAYGNKTTAYLVTGTITAMFQHVSTFTADDAVCQRIPLVFSRATPATISAYTFGRITLDGPVQKDTNKLQREVAFPFTFMATLTV